MSLLEWQQQGQLQSYNTSRPEIGRLLQVAERELADAQAEGISADLRFVCAYNAALSLATVALQCAGYRSRGVGHHATTLRALPFILGESCRDLVSYFQRCRRTRNEIEYHRSGVVSLSEAEELIQSVLAFREQVQEWLRENHPQFAPE